MLSLLNEKFMQEEKNNLKQKMDIALGGLVVAQWQSKLKDSKKSKKSKIGSGFQRNDSK
jgi:hypothetical protein